MSYVKFSVIPFHKKIDRKTIPKYLSVAYRNHQDEILLSKKSAAITNTGGYNPKALRNAIAHDALSTINNRWKFAFDEWNYELSKPSSFE